MVSIIPGIEILAPDLTEIKRGFFKSPNILEDFCILSFTGGGAQSEVGCGPIHALAHTVESIYGGHHSSLVRSIANIALPYFLEISKSKENLEFCDTLIDDLTILNETLHYEKNRFEPDVIFHDFLSDIKIDPCWRSTRARFPDNIIKNILVEASK